MRVSWLLILCATVAAAADVTGDWRLSFPRNGQTYSSTLTLKMEGDKLSGTLSSPLGTAPISEGKVSGNDISFMVVRKAQYDEIAVSYTGKIDGETMKLTMQYSGRPAVAVSATRSK